MFYLIKAAVQEKSAEIVMSEPNLDAQYEILAKGIYLYNNPNAQIQAQATGGFAVQGYIIDRVFDDPKTGL